MQNAVHSTAGFQGKSPQPTQPDDDEIDLLALLGTIWRGKWLIALITLIAAVIGAIYAFVIATPMYSATATLSVDVQGQQVVDLESVVSGIAPEDSSLNTEVAVIQSHEMMRKLVLDQNLTNDPEFNPLVVPASDGLIARGIDTASGAVTRVVEMLIGPMPEEVPPTEAEILNMTARNVSGAIGVTNRRNTYVFDIRATTTSRAKSIALSNALARIYIADQVAVKLNKTDQAAEWLAQRVSELQVQLEQKESAVNDLAANSDLISERSLEVLNVQAKDIRDRLDATTEDLAQARQRVLSLEFAAEEADVELMSNAARDPRIRSLVPENTDGFVIAGSLFEQRFNTILASAETERDRLQRQVDALESSLDSVRADIEEQSGELVRLQQLRLEAESTRTLYETFLNRLKETTVQLGLQQADARILSEATLATLVAPRKPLILALSMVLGFMAAAGLVLAREAMHSGFRTADDLEAFTGLPVIGQIPKMPIRKRDKLIDYLKDKPTSAAVEAIRNLRTSVLLSDLDNPPQVILSTSTVPGEGKTTQAISLAQNLSSLGKSVLLVEADLRRRAFTKYFSMTPKQGILALLAGEVELADGIVRSERLQADVMMGDKLSVNPVDVFSSEVFREFLSMLRGHYDYIVIDTPPVLVVPEARVIGQLVDAIVYSVAWDRTPRSQVREGLRQLSSVNLNVSGLVLAQIDPRGMKRYGYGGNYGAYAKYGKEYYAS